MRRWGARFALTGAAALIVWLAFGRPAPNAARPAEPVDTAARAVSLWRRPDTLSSGETLNAVLRRGGVDDASARDVIAATATVQDMRRLPAGMPVEFVSDSQGRAPREIVFTLDIDRLVHIERDSSGGWRAREERLPWTTDTVEVRGAVHNNLYDALSPQASRMFPGSSHDALVVRIANVYEYKIDMYSDLRTGDSVYALVQRSRGPNRTTRVDAVLAARFFTSGHPLDAYLYPDSARRAHYYDAAGRSLATMFLRTPIEFARISSRFSLSRFHPILQMWRAHRGTDYAAATGTPVRAIADGTVLRIAYEPTGYGNVIDVQHANHVVSRYGHLRAAAAGLHAGSRVVQGSTIGYVGMTGLATAPHLHFEILRNGAQVNPAIALRSAESAQLSAAELVRFAQTQGALARLLRHAEGVARLAEPR